MTFLGKIVSALAVGGTVSVADVIAGIGGFVGRMKNTRMRRRTEMTDDKGAGKLAEELFREWWLNNSEAWFTHSGIGFHAFTSGFNAGRKAERERCAKIADLEACELPECRSGSIIADKIRGGQDAK